MRCIHADMHLFKLIVVFLLCHAFAAEGLYADEGLIVQKAWKTVELSGYTRGRKTATISAEISGKVLHVNYDVGQVVRERPLVEIDPAFIKYKIENTRRSLNRLDALIMKARSSIKYLHKENARIRRLYSEDLASESQKDSIDEKLEQARLELRSREEEKAAVASTLRELRERKSRHNIHAPRGWTVIGKTVEIGEVVQPGVPLAEVSDFRTIVVPLDVSHTELSAIRALPDTFAAFLEGTQVSSSVRWINPRFNERSRKLTIELTVKGYNGVKRGGLKFRLPLRIAAEGLLVPKAAVRDRYDNPLVTLKKEGEIVQITVLGETEDYLWIAGDSRLPPGTELLSVQRE